MVPDFCCMAVANVTFVKKYPVAYQADAARLHEGG